MGVAPTRSAAARAWRSTSACEANPFAGGEAVLTLHERKPRALAVVPEARDEERAMVEQIAVRRAVLRIPGLRAHELVDVLERFVVAHVVDDAPVRRDGERRALVLEAAERRALDRLRRGIPRVDLDHPAEAVRLVRFLLAVEARVVLVPAQPLPLGEAVAAHLRRDRAAAVEVEIEVLLAREVGAPRRDAVRAVVERAQHFATRRVGRCLQRVVACGRARDRDRRERGDPPRVAGRRARPATPPFACSISITDTPCAACDLRTFSAVQVFMPSACSSPSSVYS